jgi:predicted CopG family antitoxin
MSTDTKTIEIATDAYETLVRLRRPGQTLSEVIRLHFGPSASAEELEQLAVELKVSDATLDAIEDQISARSKSPATSAGL